MTRRRTLLASLAVAALLASRSGLAQTRRVSRVGFLAPGPGNPYEATFIGAMHALGYMEGENLILERRLVPPAELPSMALELASLKIDLIYTQGSAGVRAAMAATRQLAIVASDLETDPIASGYASSLARPGGNLTGIFLDLPEFSAKRLELLKEALPTVTRVMVLWDSSLERAPLSKMDAAARLLKLTLILAETHVPANLEDAFHLAAKQKPQALLVMQSPTLDARKDRILALGAEYGLPVMAVFANFTADGALLSYGPNAHDLVARSAVYVDKVLRGANAGDLPIQRPAKFDLVVNSRTAKALGLTIGPSVMLRADEVIQ